MRLAEILNREIEQMNTLQVRRFREELCATLPDFVSRIAEIARNPENGQDDNEGTNPPINERVIENHPA